jgi:RNA polymerase sigma factor (sigma-70 family)
MAARHAGAMIATLRLFAETPTTRDLSDGQLLQRFAAHREEEAFAALVRRHGGLVWSVCRHVLPSEPDAEDAFQAAFLVLARRAASIRQTEAVAGWLHGVAYRIAVRAKRVAARRQGRERRAAAAARPEDRTTAGPPPDVALRELQALLDEEVTRLPEKLRTPFVLCCLEGRCWKDAAAELGWKEGTLATRVAQARRLLRGRLSRRGVTLSAALTAGALGGPPVPAALVRLTPQAALRGAVTPSVAALMEKGLKAMAPAKLKVAALLLLAAGLAGGLGWAVGQRPDEKPVQRSQPPGATGEGPRADPHGDPLPDGALARLGTVRWRHGSQVLTLAYSSDGQVLASGSMDEAVHLWDAKTGRLLRILRGHEAWVDSVFFTPDNKRVISCGQDKTARVWDVATGSELRRWETKGGWKMALSPDGKTLAGMGSFPGKATIVLWDVATGNKVRELPYEGGQDLAFDMAFSPDGQRLVCAGEALRCFDVAAGKQLEVFGSGQRINSVAFSPDGKMLAVGRGGAPVALWDTATLKEVRRLDGNPDGARGVAFAPDGKALAVAAYGPDGLVALWDPATGKKTRDLASKRYQVWSLTFSPDGKKVAVGNLDAVIHLYDAATGRELPASAGGHREGLSFLAFVDRDRAILTAGAEGLVRQWDLATARPAREFQEEGTSCYCGALSPDGRTLASGEGQGVHLFDWATGQKLRVLKGHKLQLFAGAFSPRGDRLASAANLDLDVLVWDVGSGKELRRLTTPFWPGPRCLAWSPDGKVLAVAGLRSDNARPGRTVGGVCLYDPATGEQLRDWAAHQPGGEPHGDGVRALAFAPDGTLLATAGDDKTVGLWDVATGTLRARLPGHRRGVTAVAFSPDGRMLASGGIDRTVRLWELTTAKERRCYEGHLGPVGQLAFSADGRRLASAGGDTSALVWSVTGRPGPGVALTPRRLEDLWNDLAGDDASRAWRAACTLSAAPEQTLPWMREHLHALSAADAGRIARLLADLDGDEFADRERAARELEKLGELAEPALRKALAGQPGAEVRRQVERLLAKLDGPVRAAEVRRGLRAVEVLEQVGTPEAQRELARLAREAPGGRIEKEAKGALKRLGQG